MDANKPKARILLVEDNYMNKVLVTEILSMNGYEIIEAKNGIEAVKTAATEGFDLILMDIQLPEMDGVTAMRIIKAEGKNRTTPVYALTASAMKGDEEELLGKGFDGYLAKPIETKKLLSLVEAGLAAGR